MADVYDEHGVPLIIAYQRYAELTICRAKDLIDAGYIGDPVLVHRSVTERILGMVPDPNRWRFDWDLSGGCATMDIGIYPLNTTRFLLDADPVGLTGSVAAVSEGFEDVPDEHTAFQLDSPDNVFAVCTASRNARMSSHIRVTGTARELRVEPAFYSWDGRKLTLSRGETTVELEFEQIDQMEEGFEYFSHRLVTGTMPYADGTHGLADIRIIKPVYESAEFGRRVGLD